MKKYFLALVLASLTLGIAQQNHVHATSTNVSTTQSDTQTPDINSWMPDKNLQSAVQDALGAGVPLTQANMSKLTQANFTADDITNLEGLQYATNLQTLDLTENSFGDLSPIGNLPNLKNLSFRFNHANSLPDLAALKNPNLQSLNLGGDSYGAQPAKLAGLVNLTQLTSLQMFATSLTALPPIAPSAPLTTLDLSLNKITDVKGLPNYQQLTSLSVSSNKITDWSPIAKLTNLTTLTAGNNPQTNIASLNTLTKLQTFNASQLNLTNQDIQTLLPKMPNLTKLAIDFNAQISDLSPLTNLTNLSTLVFSKDSVSDLKPLANLTNLTDLEFSNNQVSDITPLAKLTNLTDLEFLRNKIFDISPLRNMNQLSYFNGKFQFITQPALNVPAKNAFSTTLTVKDTDGSALPITYASGTPATVNGDNVAYTPQTADGSTNFTWSKLNTKSITKNFSGTIVQPFTLQQDSAVDQATPVKLLVTKGDNPNLTSVASTYIMQQATLLTHANGSGVLNFKLVVPANYGKDGILFKDAKQVSAQKAGDTYILNYQLPLTAAQMKEPALLENMHVDINFGDFVYNNIYNVYFKIVHSTNYDPQPKPDPNGPIVDTPSKGDSGSTTPANPTNTSNQASNPTQSTSPKPGSNPGASKQVGLQVLRGDQSQATSVASQYVQPQASLQVQPNGGGLLIVKAVVPASFGPNSLTFLNGQQTSAVKQGNNYVMTYTLPLTAAQLKAPEFLEAMHVDIKVGSFIYNHNYDVYFKINDNVQQAPQPAGPGPNEDPSTPTPATTNIGAQKPDATTPLKIQPSDLFGRMQSVGLEILRGDQSQATSVASQYVQPQANLQVQSDGSGILFVKAIVPASFGPNSLTFLSGQQISAVKQGNNYVMTYKLPLTAAQLKAPEFLEAMHVDIKVGSFIYNHVYNVFFKLHGNVGFTANTPGNLINQSFTNAAILNGSSLPAGFSTLGSNNQALANTDTTNTGNSATTSETNNGNNHQASGAVTDNAQPVKVTTAKPASSAPKKKAANHDQKATTNNNHKTFAAAAKSAATPVNVASDIKKASAFVAALLGVLAVYGGWYWFKQRK